jgi:hypothetical protein
MSPAMAAPVASQNSVLPARLDGRTYPTFYDGYRTVRGYLRFTNDLEAAYPDLVKVVTYGETYTEQNDLRAVCVTAAADNGCKLKPNVDKARFLFVAQIHARELTTSEMTWRMLTLLTDGYGKSADLTALLDETEIWVVPQLNPDGIEQVERGFKGADGDIWQRKNMHFEQDCGTGPGSQVGVDLNRNYDLDWGGAGASDIPCSLAYKGSSAASEPETYYFQGLVAELFEDQRGWDSADVRGTLLTLHTYGNQSLYPYDSRGIGQGEALRSIAYRYSHYNGYTAEQADVSGSTDLYAYNMFGIAAGMFEMGSPSGDCSGFHPAYACQDGFWELNREAFLYAARLAQEPWTMAWGPNPLRAKSKIKNPHRAVITATADDDAYGFTGDGRPLAQEVTAGRVYVGTAPWDGGTARAMKVIGSGTQVRLKVVLDRPAKDKLVWVQARDADGNWGPTRSVWLRGR